MLTIPPKTRDAYFNALIATGTPKVYLLDADYTYATTHEFLTAIDAAARLGTPATVVGLTSTNGAVSATTPTVVEDVAPSQSATQLAIVLDTGSAPTSRILYLATEGNGFTLSTNGEDIWVNWTNPIWTWNA